MMADPLSAADLRALMVTADDLPDLGAATWNKRRDANQLLSNWRTWLPEFLDRLEVPCAIAVTSPRGMSQAEAEARGLV